MEIAQLGTALPVVEAFRGFLCPNSAFDVLAPEAAVQRPQKALEARQLAQRKVVSGQ
jgi:hypothetical protein